MEIQRAEAKTVFFSDIKPGETFADAHTNGAIHMRLAFVQGTPGNSVRLHDGALRVYFESTVVKRITGKFVEGEK